MLGGAQSGPGGSDGAQLGAIPGERCAPVLRTSGGARSRLLGAGDGAAAATDGAKSHVRTARAPPPVPGGAMARSIR